MPPTIPPPKPPLRVRMTARNVVHLVLTVAIVAVLAALAFGVHPPSGLTAEQVQTACYALLVGLFIPGSPIGRILDAYFPPPGQPAGSPTLADLEAAKDAITPKPQQVPPSRTSGFVEPRALAFVLLAALFGLAGCALLLPGCGGSPVRAHAIAAHAIDEALAEGGEADVTYARTALAECPAADGAEQTACIDRVEHLAVAAAAARDVLLAPAAVYRAEVFQACGMDPAHPVVPDTCPDVPADVVHHLEVDAGVIAPLWGAFTAALVALGAPASITAVSIPGGH